MSYDLRDQRHLIDDQYRNASNDRYPDTLVVTEIEPLLRYLASGRARSAVDGERRSEIVAWAEAEIAAHGAIRITTDSGLFEAW